DGDIHSQTAMDVFNVTKEEVTPSLRRRAKAVNFGIIYGISDWGLSEQISSSPSEAKKIITTFYEKYPEIKEYFTNVINFASQNGYITTLYKRRRYINELKSSNYMTREFGKRAAMNAPIQGSAADLIKIAMIKVDEMLSSSSYKTQMVLQIHDELIFKVPKDEKEVILPKIKEIMENATALDVKLKVDGDFGRTWFDCK
ncbi:MAG: DNA polymerase, partial [Bacilli bacterium]|nr:DNA polymerase [Bacilli bacterium]